MVPRRRLARALAAALAVFIVLAASVGAFAQVRVKGYHRKDGTYVRPHVRSSPDGNPYNNWSFPGNVNPYTGKVAPGNPDAYLRNYYNRRGSTAPVPANPLPAPATERSPAPLQNSAPTEPTDVEIREAVRRVQIGLRASGFDPGAADGVLGPGTTRALSAYLTSMGVPAGDEAAIEEVISKLANTRPTMPPNAKLNYTGDGWMCNRGYFRVGDACEKVRVPSNATIDYVGDRWRCKRGYYRVGAGCAPVEVPRNATIDYVGDGWRCKRGFYRAGEGCPPVHVPANATVDYVGDGWRCKRGFYRAGDGCEVVRVPPNATIDYVGDGWMCKRGYYRTGASCAPLQVPANAMIDYTGNGWMCRSGFVQMGTSCVRGAPSVGGPAVGSSSRTYDYDVSGTKDDGTSVSGSIESSDGDIEGDLVNDDGEEIHFEGEWSKHGEMEGYDDEGNYYELEVD